MLMKLSQFHQHFMCAFWVQKFFALLSLITFQLSLVMCQFHQHFMCAFFVQKCFAQLFSYYSLSLNFIGKLILAQKLLVKC